mmetsp:Transcript_14604/g.43620  ORF Transcript_14604/g.43620 Transcript_14604/m.43620 type:complete len:298 (-) Transcript_14604:35-928(-)
MERFTMRLVNDFAANGYGVVTLEPGDYEDISPHGPIAPTEGAPVACVGAGTGLGETFATASGGLYAAWPSEGGHVAFAPRGPLQERLLTHLRHKFKGRVSAERVISGKGIVNVYEFLADGEMKDKVSAPLDRKIRSAAEGAAVVSAGSYDNAVCEQALEVVLDAYGAELGNAAVKWLPFGGLYIAGGIAIKNHERIVAADPSDSAFMQAYLDRGRLAPVLEKIPLRLVTVDDLGLRGAHYVALTVLIERDHNPAPVAAEEEPAGGVAAALDRLGATVQKAAIGLGVALLASVLLARK